MKLKTFIATLLLMLAGLQTAWAQTVIISLTNNQTVEYDVSKVKDINFSEMDIIGGHEYVDLGLPSGTLWATCNVGANSPEEYGNYYAWGEIRPKEEFTWATYLLCNGTNLTMTKYCTNSSYGNEGFTDNITQLQAKDDAATANWGLNGRCRAKSSLMNFSIAAILKRLGRRRTE